MKWYQREIEKYIVYIVLTIIIVIVSFVFNYFLKPSFEYIDYELLSPTLWPKLISSITFMTVGSFLYNIGFYKILYDSIGKFSYEFYCLIKFIIWGALMYCIYLVVTGIIYVINLLCSFVLNTVAFIKHIFLFTMLSIVMVILIYLLMVLRRKLITKDKKTPPTSQ